MPEEALQFFAEMNSSSPVVVPDYYTYSSVLKACSDARKLRLGKSVHSHLLRRSFLPSKNRVLNNSLFNMYATCLEISCSDTIENMFDRMPKKNAVSWNIMIDWYAKNSRPLESLRLFRRMVEAGSQPTTVSFVNVLPAVAAIGQKRTADALYGLLCKSGDDKLQHLFVISATIAAYSELGDIGFARLVFDRADQRNIEIWNTMIGGYVQNELSEDALQLFVQLALSDEVPVDTITLVASLIAASQSQATRTGQQIHACIIKKKKKKTKSPSSDFPVILWNALVVMYSRCNSIFDAFDVFQQMPEKDLVSWNTMISCFVQNGFDSEGLLLVCQMLKEDEYQVDSVTIVALLSAASNLGDIRIGKETHACLVRRGIECAGMSSYLIDMYSNSGSVETARRLFDSDQSRYKDQVTWNAMIAGYIHNGLVEQAISMFEQMLVQVQTPNSVTLSSILPACATVGGIRFGKQIHGYAFRNSLHRNIFVDTALIDMYSKCGSIDDAENVFSRMPDRNSVTYTTMISGLGQHGCGKKAISLFNSMIMDHGTRPDGITMVAILSACSYSGLVEEGMEIFQGMEVRFGISPTTEHYGCVTDMLARNGRVEEAYQFALSLNKKGEVVGVWGALLAGCVMHRNFELGKIVSKRLCEIDKNGGGGGYHVLMSNVYAAERDWEGVDRIRKMMKDKRLTKEIGSSWIEIGDARHTFISNGSDVN